jgi:hypothetical protein
MILSTSTLTRDEMNTQTITIQEFSRMMASDKKDVLPEFIREITKLARPEDVRLPKTGEARPSKILFGGWYW